MDIFHPAGDEPFAGAAGVVLRFLKLLCWVALALTLIGVWTAFMLSGSWAGAGAAGKRVLIVAGNVNHTASKFKMLAEEGTKQGFTVQRRYVARLTDEDYPQLFDGYDAVILDMSRAETAQTLRAKVKYHGTAPILEFYSSPNIKSAFERVSQQDGERLRQYYVNEGRKNFAGFFQVLAVSAFGAPPADIPAPIVMPEQGVYYPGAERAFGSLEEYLKWRKIDAARKPQIVGIAMPQNSVALEQTGPIDELIKRVEARGAVAAPLFYVERQNDKDVIRRLASVNGRPIVDVLVNFYTLHNATDRKAEYEALGVPVLGALTYRRGKAVDWEKSSTGIPMPSVPFSFAVPELAGVSDPLVVAAQDDDGRVEVIGRQIDALARKAINLIRLQRKANADKKVAVMFYNYPPGEKNISASFLNIPRSLVEILAAMKQYGYAVTLANEETLIRDATALTRPFYRDGAAEELANQNLAALLPMQTYLGWFERLPDKTRKEVLERWGDPARSAMTIEREGKRFFVIPRIELGNVILLPQPPRGERKDDKEKALYMDTKAPLNHFYMAAYLYVRDVFGADALAHFGTHGTQEWTPGKERGLSTDDYPNLVLGDVPVVYPYTMDNVGEALMAMRRGRATLVTHQTPPFRPAGLDKELVALHELMDRHGLLNSGAVKDKTRSDIIAIVTSRNIHKDMAWEPSAIENKFDDFLMALHGQLHTLAGSAQPLGLHTFARPPEPQHLLTTVMQMLGDELYEKLDDMGVAGELAHADYSQITASKPYQLLERHLVKGEPLEKIADKNLRALVAKAKDAFPKLMAEGEVPGWLRALDGKYAPSRVSGDPIRQPDALPTGGALYGFDPSKIPTKQAYETGKEGVESLIRDYRSKHGRYPEKLSFVLWSGETIRQHGAIEAQALYALGVKPIWDEGGRVTGTEIIPATELGRPRINVLISSSGPHRDMFPNVLQHLAEAVKKAAALKEPGNSVAAHSERIAGGLAARGLVSEEAKRLSLARIFTSESGQYGVGLEKAVLASDTWGAGANGKEDHKAGDKKLAELYVGRMGQVWSPDGTAPNEGLYAENLKDVDAAVLGRSSNLHGLLTSDDPFQFLGGLSLAVRSLKGKSPELYIANLRNPGKGKTETAAQFLATELRTRYFHPNWIAEMQKEGYSGAVKMLDVVNNFWGWQAVAPDVTRANQWQEFADIYVKDKYRLGLRDWYEKNHPQALAQIAERMLEAIRKDYWQADAQTVKELVTLYQEIDFRHNVHSENVRFKSFLKDQLLGFGLSPAPATAQAPPAQSAQAPTATAPPQQVEGQKLEKVEAPRSDTNSTWLYLLAALLMVTIVGVLRQSFGYYRR